MKIVFRISESIKQSLEEKRFLYGRISKSIVIVLYTTVNVKNPGFLPLSYTNKIIPKEKDMAEKS